MKASEIICSLFVLALNLTLNSCADTASEFKGTWEFSDSDPDSECAYTLWLDPSDKKVNQAGYENVIGVIRAYEDAGGNSGTSCNEITGFEQDGKTAEIKYRHNETGEIHKARLSLDDSGTRLRWEYIGLYKSGRNTPKEYTPSDAENPNYYEPADAELVKSSDSPNYKQIRPEDIIKELPDCTYYIEDGVICEQEDDGSWLLHAQIRCQNPTKGTDCVILDETYLWGGSNPINVSDVWSTPDHKWLYFTIWDGGTQFQTIYLYKTDGQTRATQLDEVDGLCFNPMNDGITDADVPSIVKEDGRIVVYDPSKRETRTYDL